MIAFRDRMARGHAKMGWLDSRHTFSFGHYYDPKQMGFRSLRVINEDRVIPGAGFPTHPHEDMEIISYVLEGALAHKDSLGTGSIIRPGDVQRMSAGTGIRHSEFNASDKESVHFLQIWIEPAQDGLPPSYEQKQIPLAEKRGRFRLVGGPEGGEGAITIHQDARLYIACLAPGESASHRLAPGRGAWLQLARGAVALGPGQEMKEGDGVAITDESEITVTASADSELLLFDLR
jgi:quercetin 2,3-dioxygenase